MQEMWIRFLGQDDPLEEERATGVLTGIIPCTGEPGGHPWGHRESDRNERLSNSMLCVLAEFLNQLSISRHK